MATPSSGAELTPAKAPVKAVEGLTELRFFPEGVRVARDPIRLRLRSIEDDMIYHRYIDIYVL